MREDAWTLVAADSTERASRSVGPVTKRFGELLNELQIFFQEWPHTAQ